jgi:hypothetical protein
MKSAKLRFSSDTQRKMENVSSLLVLVAFLLPTPKHLMTKVAARVTPHRVNSSSRSLSEKKKVAETLKVDK